VIFKGDKMELLIVAMVVLYTLQSLLTKKYVDHYPGNENMASSVFTIVSGGVVVIVSLCFMGFRFDAQWETLLLGVINAVVITLYNYFIVKTAQTGPYTILMVFSIAGGIIIPTVQAGIFFGQEISWLKWVATGIVLIAVFLMSYRGGGTANWKAVFIPCCFGLAIANGAYGAILNTQQELTGEAEKEELIAVTYCLAAIASFVIFLIKEKGNLSGFKQTKPSLIYLLCCSVIVALAINVLTVLIHVMEDLTALYTFDNAGTLLLSVICSMIFFKERPSAVNLIGCGIMCGALVMISVV
jgi:drug/metabolite transporter (DMT)-like permease